MSIKNYYFPPCGFGFWYQLGVLESIKDSEYKLYGSSAGSLICLVSLLDKDEKVNYLINKALMIQQIINKRGIIQIFNIYNYVSEFTNLIIDKLKEDNSEKISKKLKNIYIGVSEIKFTKSYIPYLESKFINPTNLDDLKELVISSSYVPLVSYYENLFYYEYKEKYYIDGYFSKNKQDNNYIEINSDNYATLIPCNLKRAKEMYNEGLGYSYKKNKSTNSIIFVFIVFFNLIRDLFRFFFEKIDSTHRK
jgi:hypothetical protein